MEDVRVERLRWIDGLRVRRGHCPRCGGPLVEQENRDRIEAWRHVPRRFTVRAIGGGWTRTFPAISNVEVQHCKRCDACERWYRGKWAYWRKAE